MLRFNARPARIATFAANFVNQRRRVPITVGLGRYGPDQRLEETFMARGLPVKALGKDSPVTKHRVALEPTCHYDQQNKLARHG